MQIKAISTGLVCKCCNLEDVLDNITELHNGDVVAVTSKVVSLCEGRCVDKSVDKYQLIKDEADILFETEDNPYGIYLTVKNGILIPSAGIDESNSDGHYVLYPEDPWKSAEKIWRYLRDKFGIADLGVIITDSHTTIMRRGVTGIALSWCGFLPLHSYINQPDLYGRLLRVTYMNIVDALAVSAVFVMGEGNERTPIAVISNAPKLNFLDRPPNNDEKESIVIDISEDLYGPLLSAGLNTAKKQ